MIDKGDSVGIVACSDPLDVNAKEQVHEVENNLYDIGLNTIVSKYLYTACSAYDKAVELNEMYKNDDVKCIFDISGGDIANEVLPYLDYDAIASANKPFFGYSDLTTVINAIYTKTGRHSYLYQVRNLIYEHKERQMADFEMTVLGNEDDLYDIEYEFVQGRRMKGVVVGGNIRCFLKLAGTEYMPNLRHKILLLEACSGNEFRIRTYFSQFKQMGAFDDINGILLGTFLELEKEGKNAFDILKEILNNDNIPVVVTEDIGHRADSKAILIGKEIDIEE